MGNKRDEMNTSETLKTLLITNLQLTDLSPEDITPESPLFGDEDGLGLDSLDAVELVVLVEKHFGVEIKDVAEGQRAFASFQSLVDYIEEHRKA